MSGHPETVAELGPGGSIGCGLAALLSGCSRYYALDAVNLVSVDDNLRVLDELVELFSSRSSIPGGDEFPDIRPPLETCDFPSTLLGDELLGKALDRRRIQRIRNSIAGGDEGDGQMVTYRAPWSDPASIPEGSVDLLFSQAVLEHVDDLPEMYRCMHLWLRPGGCVSHTIDFRSHETSRAWNGHWACGDLLWKVIRGRRPCSINREPLSTHVDLLTASGFAVAAKLARSTVSEIQRSDLARRFRGISDSDLTTSGVFLVGTRTKAAPTV